MSRSLYGIWLGLALGFATAAHAGPNCPVPDGSLPFNPKLPMTVKALATHQPLKILTIGIASVDASKPDASRSFAAKLAEILRSQPGSGGVTLVDKRLAGSMAASMEEQIKRGVGAPAMIDLLKREALPEHPTLILWGVGSYSAVNGADPRQFASDVLQSLQVLKDAHIDVILIDMQYSPAASQMIDFRPYLEALQVVADTSDTPLFGRFDAMRAWSDSGVFDLDGMEPENMARMSAEVDVCLGVGLAEVIDLAAKLHPSSASSQ